MTSFRLDCVVVSAQNTRVSDMHSDAGHDVIPFWVAGRTQTGEETFDVHNPYTGEFVWRFSIPTPAQVDHAVELAAGVADKYAALPVHVRAEALDHVVAKLIAMRETVATRITTESGKPLKWARIEVTRAISTFRFAALHARTLGGEFQRLDTDPQAEGRACIVRRFPRGPILGVTPFNFPLNLVAHKVAPAIAVGAPIIVKPSPRTPYSALLLGELLADTPLPEGAVAVLPVPNDRAESLTTDPRLPVVSFTGSVPIGWSIQRAVPRKHVLLELGGNAAAVVTDDYPDLDWAAKRIATFGNYQAGQSCIAVQRVFVARSRYNDMVERIVAEVNTLQTGDPADENTDIGPVINNEAADRIEAWVAEATAAGARVLTSGHRTGSTLAPIVLTDVPADAKVNTEELFGPVLTITPFDTVDEAFDLVNASQFGLQAGVFTTDIGTAFAAQQRLKVGGVIIGDVPSYRADQMPYGGTKASGVGREGVAHAMNDFTEPRTLVLTGLPL